jgi:hypothetical protein
LANYEGPPRRFERADLALALNGMILTLAERGAFASLEDFHRQYSDVLIADYLVSNQRRVWVRRADVELEAVVSPDPFGVRVESIDGRQIERPMLSSNQIDASALPFMRGPVPRRTPHFPWGASLDISWYPELTWLIGSRGLPGEGNYAAPTTSPKVELPPEADGEDDGPA